MIDAAKLEEVLALRDENAKLRDALAQKAVDTTLLTELALRDGGMNAAFEGGAAGLLAECFAEQFVGSGATNYLEISFSSAKLGARLVVTMQLCTGKTPHQLRQEAGQQLAALRAQVEAHNAACDECCDARAASGGLGQLCAAMRRTSKGRCSDCPQLGRIEAPEGAGSAG